MNFVLIPWDKHVVMERLAKLGGLCKVAQSSLEAEARGSLSIDPLRTMTFCVSNNGVTHSFGAFARDKVYVVQTTARSNRTLHSDDHRPRRPGARPHLRLRHIAYVAEQWGRRWITIDTSRVALALARRPRHGRPLSLVSAGRQPGRPASGSRASAVGTSP